MFSHWVLNIYIGFSMLQCPFCPSLYIPFFHGYTLSFFSTLSFSIFNTLLIDISKSSLLSWWSQSSNGSVSILLFYLNNNQIFFIFHLYGNFWMYARIFILINQGLQMILSLKEFSLFSLLDNYGEGEITSVQLMVEAVENSLQF